MQLDSKIYVAGANGLVGSAIVRKLQANKFSNLLTQRVELKDNASTVEFFEKEKPDYVFLAAAKVGGIVANRDYPADFIRDNLLIQTNVIRTAHLVGVKKLLFLGSSCIYPKMCPQPIKEEYLLQGPLEPTNSAYAIAKIAGLEMIKAYRQQYKFNGISLMPTNLYGPNDNFNLQHSHVLPAMIRKFHDAKVSGQKEVTLWGDGSARREFLHVDDLASACLILMDKYDSDEIINVGTGEDVTIKELATIVADKVNYSGKIEWDASKPNGTPRKVLYVDKLNRLGFKPSINLIDGIASTYKWYLEANNCRR